MGRNKGTGMFECNEFGELWFDEEEGKECWDTSELELPETCCDKCGDRAETSVFKGGAKRTYIEGVDSVLFVLEQDIDTEEK